MMHPLTRDLTIIGAILICAVGFAAWYWDMPATATRNQEAWRNRPESGVTLRRDVDTLRRDVDILMGRSK